MKKRTRTCDVCKKVEETFSKSNTCAACARKNKQAILAVNEIQELTSYGYTVLSGPTLDNHGHNKYTVLTPCCNKEYEPLMLTVRSMMQRRGIPPCSSCGGKERMSKAFTAYLEEYGVDYDLEKFDDYSKIVRGFTEKTYQRWKHIINPSNLQRGYANWHLDHKVPVLWCFKNGVLPELAGSVLNLQMLRFDENIRKLAKVPDNPHAILSGDVVNVMSYDNPTFTLGKINVWPHQFKNQQLINAMMLNKLGSSIKLDARKLTIGYPSPSEARLFMSENHLAGSTNSSYRFGLYSNNELMMLITIGKPRFSNKFDYEVLRLATKQGVVIRGGASKLFKVIKNTLTGTLLTYSDNMLGNGAVYAKTGFEFIGETSPGYFWEKDGKILERYETQKHKLGHILPTLDLAKSESMLMEENGWRKIFNAGNKKWKLQCK